MKSPADYRQRIYEKYASTFKNASGLFDENEPRRIGRVYGHYLRGWLPADMDTAILDVGCGTGALLYWLKTIGYRNVCGVDISAEQVALARQVALDVEQGDAVEYLRKRPGQFGLITAIDVIEHLGKAEALDFLDAVHAALRPGGRAILQSPNANSPRCANIRYGDFTHEICFTPALLGRVLALCGFTGYRAREMGPVPHGLKSALRWILWRVVRLRLALFDQIETGTAGDRIYTRVFIAAAQKPAS